MMREVRRLTDPRTRTKAMTENAMVPAARNTMTANIMVALSRNRLTSVAEFMRQTLKFTSRYMMKLPMPIQQAAIASTILVRS